MILFGKFKTKQNPSWGEVEMQIVLNHDSKAELPIERWLGFF
jgi:hypothetical protein